MRTTVIAALGATFILTACYPSAIDEQPSTMASSTTAPAALPRTSAGTPRDAASAPASDAERRAANASNAFAFELHPRVSGSPSENLVYSPASISVALAMTSLGARGVTGKEMASVLHLDAGSDAVHQGWRAMGLRWSAASDVELALANRLYGQSGYPFETPFLTMAEERYGAPLLPVDFAHDPESQRKQINDWVADTTHQRIVDLVPRGAIDGSTRLVLANALYFKADWQRPFDPIHTESAAFTTAAGERVIVSMMQQVADIGYAEIDGVRVAQLAYRGGEFATLLVLPPAGEAIETLEKRLSPALLHQWAESLEPEALHLRMPRFKVEPGDAVRLKKPLSDLGMASAFGPANFDGIAKGSGLYIDDVYHKAFVGMDETGTEAAAATAVVMTESAPPPLTGGKPLTLDRPFLFFITDVKSGLVMFAGRVAKP